MEGARADGHALVDRLVRLGLWVAVGVLALQTVSYLVADLLLDGRVFLLDLDEEATIGTWVSVVVTYTAALAALVLAVVGGPRLRLLVLAALVGFLSLDDLVAIHERFDSPASAHGESSAVLWGVVYVPVLGTTFALLWFLSNRLEGRLRTLLRAGGVLLACAVAVDLAGETSLVDETSVLRPLQVALEEGLELMGWQLIAVALLGCALRGVVDARTPFAQPQHYRIAHPAAVR